MQHEMSCYLCHTAISEHISLDKLDGIGCVRYCLSVVADFMSDVLQQNRIPNNMKSLFAKAKTVCEKWEMEGAR